MEGTKILMLSIIVCSSFVLVLSGAESMSESDLSCSEECSTDSFANIHACRIYTMDIESCTNKEQTTYLDCINSCSE